MSIESDIALFRKQAQRDIDHCEKVISDSRQVFHGGDGIGRTEKQVALHLMHVYEANKKTIENLMDTFEEIFGEYAPLPLPAEPGEEKAA